VGEALLLVVLVALAYVVYRVPDVLTITVGGIALALVLSFPVRLLSRFMPRGLAILLSFLFVVGLVVLAALFIVPLVVEQLASLISAVPGIANTVGQYLQDALSFLQNRGYLPGATRSRSSPGSGTASSAPRRPSRGTCSAGSPP
jgi:predicted PurR-regulated permease PerM